MANWEELKANNDYEICTSYPYQIRRKSDQYIVSEYVDNSNGYIKCTLNRKHYFKHRLIAEQWIPNPNNLPQVDHINHDRTDNHIENLRYVSAQMNSRNQSRHNGNDYTFYDELPENAEILESYNGHDLDGVYVDYENHKLYLFNGIRYRELIPCRARGNIRYRVRDIENKDVSIYYSVLFG